jgi:transposase InsO family protein
MPNTPEQNGLVERFFRSLKKECVSLHNFGSFAEARAAITKWISVVPTPSVLIREPGQYLLRRPFAPHQ